MLRIEDASIVAGESKMEWNDFWRTVTMFQFLPDFVFLTESGANARIYDQLPMTPFKVTTVTPLSQSAWQEVWEMIQDPRLRELLTLLSIEGFKVPDAYYEIVEGGVVVAASELAWPELKTAIVPCREDYEACTRLGWRVMEKENLIVNHALAWMKGA